MNQQGDSLSTLFHYLCERLPDIFQASVLLYSLRTLVLLTQLIQLKISIYRTILLAGVRFGISTSTKLLYLESPLRTNVLLLSTALTVILSRLLIHGVKINSTCSKSEHILSQCNKYKKTGLCSCFVWLKTGIICRVN